MSGENSENKIRRQIETSIEGTLGRIDMLLGLNTTNISQTECQKKSLMRAVVSGNFEIVKLIIKHKFSLDIQDECGRTALTYAAQYGYLGIVQLLIDRGASVDLQLENG